MKGGSRLSAVGSRRAALGVALAAALVVPASRLLAQERGPAASPPASATPPFAADSGTTSYEVAGVPVVHRHAANDVVAANLYLLGGVRQVTPATSGLEPFLLEAR